MWLPSLSRHLIDSADWLRHFPQRSARPITQGTDTNGRLRRQRHDAWDSLVTNLLEAKGLSAAYGETKVLHGIDFAVRQGGVTALLGANGAGKTTTLRAICGQARTQGTITLGGQRIDGMATEDIVRLGVAHVPEGRGTFMELTVEENMKLGAYSRPAREETADFAHMFDYFPRLKERFKQQAGTLSGGEQQMLAIVRALLLRPRLLLLDEPSFGLAPLVVQEIFRILKRIRADAGVSILLVEQNATLALEFAEDAYVLETGDIVMSGPSAEISKDEGIRRSYLGY
jgi:branched-chain amino acid transport system ATP-binding protein